MQKSGWLQKKSSGFLSRWQTRFVIVWDGFITIKHVPSKNKCKQFETVSAVKETDDKSFSVNCKDGKKLLLQCNSVAEREEWIAALVRGALEDMHGDGDVRQEQSNIDKEQTQEYENSGNLKQTPLEPSNSVISRNGREFRSLSYPSGQYVGEFQSGERHGMGRFEYHNGNVYIGSWNKDRKCGYGTLTWANNDQYRGDWKDNKMWGYGDFKYHNGNSYTGNFVADNKEGFGKFIWNNGDMYEGYWFQDEMSGEGTIKYINGNMYVGEMKSNLKSGKGRMRWASGDEYEGEWKAGVMNGIGRFSYAEDGLYDGAWLNDKRHGRGTMKYVNGDVYDGMWQNDMRQGEGRCEYANKDVFVGNFVANFREGWGVYTTAPVKVLMPDAALPKVLPGDEYSGNWHKDKKHGYGKYSWSDGDCYEGDWENDLRNNHGVCVYSNGDKYEGEWCDDLRHGFGKLVWADGNTYEGVWRNDNISPGTKGVPPHQRTKKTQAPKDNKEAHVALEIPDLQENAEPHEDIPLSASIEFLDIPELAQVGTWFGSITKTNGKMSPRRSPSVYGKVMVF